MKRSDLEEYGFEQYGIFTLFRPEGQRRRVNGVYYDGISDDKIGVYAITYQDYILRIGETMDSAGMKRRIANYLSNPDGTNKKLRDYIVEGQLEKLDFLFLPLSKEEINFNGLSVYKSISPRALETALLNQFIETSESVSKFKNDKNLPELNIYKR